MTEIDTFILTDGQHQQDVERLENLFSSPLFNVKVVVIPKKLENQTTSSIEETYIKLCLQQSQSSRSVICIKDSSVTTIAPDDLERLCTYIQRRDFDLFYLCRWQDFCQKITDISSVPGININIGRTYNPHGFQAVYFSQNGKDVLLGNSPMRNKQFLDSFCMALSTEIHSGNIVAYCTLNNVFNFDIVRAVSNLDYLKTHECAVVNSTDQDISTNNGILWFLLLLAIVIVISYAIIRIGKK